jgi:hypothetical protein
MITYNIVSFIAGAITGLAVVFFVTAVFSPYFKSKNAEIPTSITQTDWAGIKLAHATIDKTKAIRKYIVEKYGLKEDKE